MAAKKPIAFKRDRPDLPADLESTEEAARLFVDGEAVTIEEKGLRDLERPNLKIGALRVESSLLERVQLAGGQWGSVVWKDVRLAGCDLANVRAHRIALVRVELVDCRLTGFRASALDWQDVLIQNGDVRYAQFQSGKFRSCEFDGCNFEEADFQEADLTGSIFRSCNLARADFHRAKLRNTDFRKSEVDGMLVGMGDLQGAIVDPSQAMILARLMGLQIG
ncbi:MAG TPA: pentapeptide repeat-containing protein [Bryobacteraceae bacterium]|nr:pentapeptide repeat-containing protein [Bryobacteraceae bacterium]